MRWGASHPDDEQLKAAMERYAAAKEICPVRGPVLSVQSRTKQQDCHRIRGNERERE